MALGSCHQLILTAFELRYYLVVFLSTFHTDFNQQVFKYFLSQCFSQAYVKFKGIPVKISTNGNPFHSPNGFLPYLKDNNETIAGYGEIIAYFQSKVRVDSFA